MSFRSRGIVLVLSVALVSLMLLTTFSALHAAGNDPSPSNTDDPVLMIHGFADVSVTPWWNVLEGYLEDEGYTNDQLYRLNLGEVPLTTVKSPRDYAEKVCSKVEDISVEHGGSSVDIIAHSMGGLDSRWCIEENGGDYYVDDLITIATPHQGTYVAILGAITPAGRDMIPGSPFLENLNDDKLHPDVEYSAVWGTLDEAMLPNTNAKLPPHMTWSTETRNIKAGPYGHISLVLFRSVFNQYVMYLD